MEATLFVLKEEGLASGGSVKVHIILKGSQRCRFGSDR
jgi:hypothetical protein